LHAAAVAAYGCLKALNTLLDAVCERKHLLPVLEDITFPIMAKCISADGQDVLEDVLELLGYFTYFGGECCVCVCVCVFAGVLCALERPRFQDALGGVGWAAVRALAAEV
jgi:hypothetical protein